MNSGIENQNIILEIFGKKLIDYAGLFPPASLDLKTSFFNYIKYLQSQYNWLLSKFIVPAKRLPELASLIEDEKIILEKPIHFSILGGKEVALSKFFDALSDDINRIREFKSKFGDETITETYEVSIPLELLVIPDNKTIVDFFTKVSSYIFGKLNKNISVFYEAVPNKDLALIAQSITMFNLMGHFAGFKMRTGGVEASAFPPPEKIAHALKICSEHETPVKCTAGLHHPFRHFNKSVNTKMHGFMNVFCAGIFAYNLDLNEYELTRMLLEENPANFKFSNDSISYENYEVFEEEISDAREKFMISFGSCSFEEPIEDLKSLKLL